MSVLTSVGGSGDAQDLRCFGDGETVQVDESDALGEVRLESRDGVAYLGAGVRWVVIAWLDEETETVRESPSAPLRAGRWRTRLAR